MHESRASETNPPEAGAPPREPDYRDHCPNCGAEMRSRSCKSRCSRCHYFTDCSDPW